MGGNGRRLGAPCVTAAGTCGRGRAVPGAGLRSGHHTPAGALYPPLAGEDPPVLMQAALAECEQVETFHCDHRGAAGAVCEGA